MPLDENGNEIVIPPDDDDNLPQELKGKKPSEIAAYYQDREAKLTARLNDAVRVVPQGAQPVVQPAAEPTAQDFWNNPVETTKKLSVTREEFNQATKYVQSNMIEMAGLVAAKRFKDWDKWEGEVRKILSAVPDHLKTDPVQWETAYYYVKGQQYDRGVKEAAVTATRIATEPVAAPAGQPTNIPKELTFEEKYVSDGLGLSGEQYRDGKKNLAEDKWPITFDSRKKR
jgi:hypothetical protein